MITDLKIVEIEKKIKWLIFFTKKEIRYHVQMNNGRILYTTYKLNDAERFRENFILYYNSPRFIIEKNGMDEYRIKKRKEYFQFSSVNFNIDYYIYIEKEFSSLQEAENFIDKETKKNKWEKIKEIK